MVYHLPALIWVLLLGYAVGMAVLPGVALARGGAARAGTVLSGLIATGMLASTWIAARGGYRQTSGHSFEWVGVPLVTLLALLLLGSRLRAVRRSLAHPAMPVWLAQPQAFRLAGIIFVVLVFRGDLPVAFGLPAGLGDMAVAVTALIVTRRPARRRLVWFNVFGLLDLVVAVTLGSICLPGLVHLLHVHPSTAAMTLVPLALVPSVGVPVMAALHLVSLRNLAEPPARGPTARRPGQRTSHVTR
jgi:hypothetical protein